VSKCSLENGNRHPTISFKSEASRLIQAPTSDYCVNLHHYKVTNISIVHRFSTVPKPFLSIYYRKPSGAMQCGRTVLLYSKVYKMSAILWKSWNICRFGGKGTLIALLFFRPTRRSVAAMSLIPKDPIPHKPFKIIVNPSSSPEQELGDTMAQGRRVSLVGVCFSRMKRFGNCSNER